jgi:hypothetical protein
MRSLCPASYFSREIAAEHVSSIWKQKTTQTRLIQFAVQSAISQKLKNQNEEV